jgi:hypothetical protein
MLRYYFCFRLESKINLTKQIKKMKKRSFLTTLLLGVILSINAQITNPFFDHVSYIGAFDGTNNWTSGWTNFNPDTVNYPTATVTLSDSIYTNTTLNATTVYKLLGFVYVTQNATLTIPAGTIIRGGDATASLIVEKGSKIIAQGTPTNPIVFTSNNPAGSRAGGDWGGIVLCGKAINNLAGGSGTAEGGIRSTYGGTDNADSTGVLSYVRIEYAGYALQPNKEINGLTFYSVGNKTKIDYIQVSMANDDSYEWFGGAVNAKHLIAFRGLDDDFDTDNGYCGNVQFALVLRDPNIADISGSNGFESDNDASASTNSPKTSATFSNISVFGPLAVISDVVNTNYKRAMHIRRNSALSIYNTFFAGYPYGLCIDGALSEANAQANELKIEYSIIAGAKSGKYFSIGAAPTDSVLRLAAVRDYFFASTRHNDTLATNDLLQIANPFLLTAPNFQPQTGSPVINRSIWYVPSAISEINRVITPKIYPNPFTNSLTIELEIAKSGMLNIDIYDVLGRKIDQLVSQEVNAGKFNSNHTFSGIKTGIYFLQITQNNNSTITKIIAQ